MKNMNKQCDFCTHTNDTNVCVYKEDYENLKESINNLLGQDLSQHFNVDIKCRYYLQKYPIRGESKDFVDYYQKQENKEEF